MNKLGPIIIIVDDPDEQIILNEVFAILGYENEIIYFGDGVQALHYLSHPDSKPFIILSDINMPKLTGLEIRNKIKEKNERRLRCVPFLFFTTIMCQQSFVDVYSHSAQGFFIKRNSTAELECTLRKIIEYWQECQSFV